MSISKIIMIVPAGIAEEDPSSAQCTAGKIPRSWMTVEIRGPQTAQATMDRSIWNVLKLPFFDDGFRDALTSLKIDKVEYWMALASDPNETADQKLSGMLPALTTDVEESDRILRRLDMVNTLASLVNQLSHKIQREIASDLGYGAADVAMARGKRPLDPSPPPVQQQGEIGVRPGGEGPREEIPSLQAVESSERRKWGSRLQQIAVRAGAAAEINNPARCQGLTPEEARRLKTMAFEAGGFRTIRQNVRYWERFEEWATGKGVSVYPPSTLSVTGYALHLRDSGCGPSILPAFKYAVGWICKKLVMKTPLLDTADPQLKALIDQVHLDRGKELKEAVPVPIKLVAAMELYVVTLIKEKKEPAAIFLWWALILIYSSLRFDDGVHVAPTSLQMTEEALLGVVWQTKVERKRKGTRFAVPVCSISDTSWLEIGWPVFQAYRSDRDYFLWDLQDEKTFSQAPVTYNRSLEWLKHFMLMAIVDGSKRGDLNVNDLEELKPQIAQITWHSMRVTLLAEAVRNNVDDKIVGLQANWKDPKQLVLKYARQRKELSVAMVKEMTGKIKDNWQPGQEIVVDEEEEIEEPFMPIEYLVKAQLPARALAASDLKCHILDPSVSTEASLCGRLKVAEAESVGRRPTCMVCKICNQKAGLE